MTGATGDLPSGTVVGTPGLVAPISTVRLPIAHPPRRDAPLVGRRAHAARLARELVALARVLAVGLVAAVATVHDAVATPAVEDAEAAARVLEQRAVGALERARRTRVVTARLVRVIGAVDDAVAAMSGRHAHVIVRQIHSVSAPELVRITGGIAVALVTSVLAVEILVADVVVVDAESLVRPLGDDAGATSRLARRAGVRAERFVGAVRTVDPSVAPPFRRHTPVSVAVDLRAVHATELVLVALHVAVARAFVGTIHAVWMIVTHEMLSKAEATPASTVVVVRQRAVVALEEPGRTRVSTAEFVRRVGAVGHTVTLKDPIDAHVTSCPAHVTAELGRRARGVTL